MTKKPPPNGTVFIYPYVWQHQADRGIENAKDRTCCMALSVKGKQGEDRLLIVPISDRKGDDASRHLEVPQQEKRLAGLDTTRAAFVHVNESNFDRLQDSWYLNSRAKPLGRFSPAFSRHIVETITKRLKAKAFSQIDRTK